MHASSDTPLATDSAAPRPFALARDASGRRLAPCGSLKAKALAVMVTSALVTVGCSRAGVAAHDGNKTPIANDAAATAPHAFHQCAFSVSFSPDGRYLAAGGGDERDGVNVWSLPDGRLAMRLRAHKHGVSAVAFSPDGKTLAAGGFGDYDDVVLWSWPAGKERSRIPGNSFVKSLAFSPDGQQLFWCAGDRGIQRWSVAGSHCAPVPRDAKTLPLNPVALDPKGNTLATSGRGGDVVHLWSMSNGKLQTSLSLHSWQTLVHALAFSPDGTLLAVGAHGLPVHLWPLPDGERWATLEGDCTAVEGLAFSPDGAWLAAAGNDDHQAVVEVWSLSEGRVQTSWKGGGRIAYGVAFNRDGTRLAWGDSEGHVFLCELDGEKRRWALTDPSVLNN